MQPTYQDRPVFELSGVGQLQVDARSGAIMRANGAICAMLGYAEDELVGRPWRELSHPDDREADGAQLVRLAAGELCELVCEHRYVRKDGSTQWVFLTAVTIRDEQGRPRYILALVHDIAGRKEAERLLEERVAEIETLMEAVRVPILVAHDPACRLITGNSTGYRLLRREPGSNLSRTAPPGERPEGFRVFRAGMELAGDELPMQRAARTGEEVEEAELELRFTAGDVVVVSGYAAPLFSAEGEVRGCIGVYLDVSERRRLDEERAALLAAERRAREEAQAAVQVRDSFLSIAAHELKTPLTVMLGNAQLLQRRAEAEPAYSERDRRAIKAVADQTVRLERMIAALLDVSRLEAGQLQIARAPFDLAALALRLVQEVRPTLRAHSIVYLGEGPVPVDGDALRIEQVLQNLLANAVKYSPAGGPITVRASAGGGRAAVSVSDEGIGIPEADVPRLFSRFFRGANAGGHHIGGIGIGLYVVREIVSLHGGEVQVASRVGSGTTVTITLPLHCAGD